MLVRHKSFFVSFFVYFLPRVFYNIVYESLQSSSITSSIGQNTAMGTKLPAHALKYLSSGTQKTAAAVPQKLFDGAIHFYSSVTVARNNASLYCYNDSISND